MFSVNINYHLIAYTLLVLFSGTQSSYADNFKITSSGDLSRSAIVDFKEQVETNYSATKLEFIEGIAASDQLRSLLENGTVDLAVIPFSVLPELQHSPLTKPFMSKDAAGIRQAVNSQAGAFGKVSLENNNLIALDFWHLSSEIFASSLPVDDVASLAGRQIAVPSSQNEEVLFALGAQPIIMPSEGVFQALEAGALDSTPIPYNERSISLGFNQVVNNYVDRVYQPNLYAVVVAKDRWLELSFLDQTALAKSAFKIGEALAERLDVEAQSFKQAELQGGATFAKWDTQDVEFVQVASFKSLDPSLPGEVSEDLIRLAFAASSAVSDQDPGIEDVPLPSSQVEIVFATDRRPVPGGIGATAFSSKRVSSGLSFGLASVSLHQGRRYGDDLEEKLTIQQINPMEQNAFISDILGQASQDDRQIVLFVHGYNNSFADAVYRAATIKADIAPDALVMSYSWPSEGNVLSYGYDASSIGVAEQNFKLLMELIVNTVAPEQVSIIAHSMGGRLLIRYIDSLQDRRILPSTIRFKNLIFAATDETELLFEQKVEHPISGSEFRLGNYADVATIYVSEHDRPLGLSKKVHGDKRLGLSRESELFLGTRVESIDASQIDPEPARWYQRFNLATRHSYVFDKARGVEELSLLLLGKPPQERPKVQQKLRDGIPYWVLKQ